VLVCIKKSEQWNKLNLLSKAVYVSEQVCIGWCRTGAYYTAKLTFFHDFSIHVWCSYYTSVHIYSSFYGNYLPTLIILDVQNLGMHG